MTDIIGSESCDIPRSRVRLWVNVQDHLAIPAGTGNYAAKISLHIDPDDAASGTGASSAVGGNSVIVRSVEALDVEVKANQQPAVAHVGTSPTPFLWFRDASAVSGLSSSAHLGFARADLKELKEGQMVYNKDGTMADGDDLIPPDSVSISIEGDLSIGAFNLDERQWRTVAWRQGA